MPETGRARPRHPWPVLLAVVAWTAPGVRAAEPAVRDLDVRGLQAGGTTTIVLDGDDLGAAPRLLLPFPFKQTLQAGSTATRATFAVTLDGAAPPGYHNLRVVTDGGVSLPVILGVDRLPQRRLAAAVDRLPVALHGALTGSTVASTRFTGKAGTKVFVEVEAQRLGGGLRPVVHLHDARRRQIAWAWPRPALSGDVRLEATLPADGAYTVSVHDAEYAGAAPGFFRLKVGRWSFVDQVFPPVIGKDQRTVELLGAAPVRIDLPAPRGGPVLALPWPRAGDWSGPRPFVRVSPHAEVVAAGDGKVQALPAGPVGVCGRLREPFTEDRFRVPVKPGSKVRFEAFAERLGSPLQVALVVRNEAGVELARAEDAPGTLDPALEFAVPDKVTAILVGVVDTQGLGSPRGVYRLTAGPAPAPETPDYRLFTPAQRVSLPVGGRGVIPVFIERRGFQGKVDLSAEGLPAGVKLDGATIPAGAEGALVTVHRAAAGGEPALTHWRGRGEAGQQRPVLVPEGPLTRLQPWLATELAVAPTTARAADFQIDWHCLPADAGIVPTRKLDLQVKLVRPAGTALVRLGLLTSQAPPLVNGQPDQGRALRAEKPVELAAGVAEGGLTVLVPAELAAPAYEVVIQAELLSADRKAVLATAFTPVRRLPVRQPLVVLISGPTRLPAAVSATAGAAVEVKGKVERRERLAGDVTLTLTGLPPGASAAPALLKGTATAFTLKVVLPANLPAGEVKGLKLVATMAPDPKQPALIVRSRDVELTLAVGKAGK